MDATEHKRWASEFNVKGFPTIISFPAGKKTVRSGKPYNGQRVAGDLIKHAEGIAGAAGAAKVAPMQITSAAVWSEACSGKTVCVIAVLPHVSWVRGEGGRRSHIKGGDPHAPP